MKKERYARVYRFHETVAFNTNTSKSLYLSPALARQFAETLIRYADDCERCKFTESTLGTTIVEG